MAMNTSVKLAFKGVKTSCWNLGGSVFRGSLLNSGPDFFSPFQGFFSSFGLGAAEAFLPSCLACSSNV
jgi:hypothetical protein